LGAIDPRAETLCEPASSRSSQVFDLTNAKPDNNLSHNKFVNSPELVRLFGERAEKLWNER
jgi:esterase/lipase superfamily enzyme